MSARETPSKKLETQKQKSRKPGQLTAPPIKVKPSSHSFDITWRSDVGIKMPIEVEVVRKGDKGFEDRLYKKRTTHRCDDRLEDVFKVRARCTAARIALNATPRHPAPGTEMFTRHSLPAHHCYCR